MTTDPERHQKSRSSAGISHKLKYLLLAITSALLVALIVVSALYAKQSKQITSGTKGTSSSLTGSKKSITPQQLAPILPKSTAKEHFILDKAFLDHDIRVQRFFKADGSVGSLHLQVEDVPIEAIEYLSDVLDHFGVTASNCNVQLSLADGLSDLPEDKKDLDIQQMLSYNATVLITDDHQTLKLLIAIISAEDGQSIDGAWVLDGLGFNSDECLFKRRIENIININKPAEETQEAQEQQEHSDDQVQQQADGEQSRTIASGFQSLDPLKDLASIQNRITKQEAQCDSMARNLQGIHKQNSAGKPSNRRIKVLKDEFQSLMSQFNAFLKDFQTFGTRYIQHKRQIYQAISRQELIANVTELIQRTNASLDSLEQQWNDFNKDYNTYIKRLTLSPFCYAQDHPHRFPVDFPWVKHQQTSRPELLEMPCELFRLLLELIH